MSISVEERARDYLEWKGLAVPDDLMRSAGWDSYLVDSSRFGAKLIQGEQHESKDRRIPCMDWTISDS